MGKANLLGSTAKSKIGRPPRSAEDRFLEKVDRDGLVPAVCPGLGPCWVWAAGLHPSGYGWFWDGHKHVRAHRFAYEHFVGPVPGGRYVCHRCDEPRCVSPNHLFLGTHDDNMADMVAKGRQSRGEDNGRAKITTGQVHMIRTSPKSHVALAKELGVGPTAVRNARAGKTWKNR